MSLRINDAQVAALGAAGCPVQSVPSFLGIALVDTDGDPVPNEPFEVELPDGARVRGTTGSDGKAFLEAVPRGTCKVTFPDADLAQSCAAGSRHTFEKRGQPTFAKIRFLDREGKPRVGLKYELSFGDVVKRGTTDGDGFLREKVTPRAETVRLTLADGGDREEVELALAGFASTYSITSRWETRRVRLAQGIPLAEHIVRYLQRRRLPGLTVVPAGSITYESRAQRVRYEVTFTDEKSDLETMLETEDLLAVSTGHAWDAIPDVRSDLRTTSLRCRALVLLGSVGFGGSKRNLRRSWPRTADGNDAYTLDRTGTPAVAGCWLHRLFTYPHASAGLPWRGALEYAKRMANRDLLARGEVYRMVTS